MSVWRVILATAVIFIAGLIAGGLAVHQLHVRRQQSAETNLVAAPPMPDRVLWPRTPTNNVPPANPSAWKRLTVDFLDRFGEELALTAEQRSRIEVIITDGQKRTKEISDQLQPKLREELKHTREQIRAELDPEQRAKFDAIYKAKTPPRKPGDPAPAKKGDAKGGARATNAPAQGPVPPAEK